MAPPIHGHKRHARSGASDALAPELHESDVAARCDVGSDGLEERGNYASGAESV